MLKRFSIENFLSYQEENNLDLTAGRTEFHSSHIYDFKKTKLLKSAIIYGANASGKSNLIKAIEYAKDIITDGLKNIDTQKKYFRLDKKSINKPTQFEFELEINDKFYSYGLSAILQNKKVEEEWLYEIGKSSPELIFERKLNQIKIGKLLTKKTVKERFKIYADDMKNQSHQLFLSEIANKELEEKEVQILNQVYNWFTNKLIILYPNTKYGNLSFIGSDNNLSKIFKKHLKVFDTGIVDISSIEEDFEQTFKEFPKEIKIDIEKDLVEDKDKNRKVILRGSNGLFATIYKDKNGELKIQKLGLVHNQKIDDIFELQDESDGTKRLFDLIPLITKFNDDYTILIDEFDRSLHPMLTKAFFELFYRENCNKSQLIVTSHESTLLDLELVRRDEIWFAEKDKNGTTKLFSLNQFKERYDKKIEKAYLLGRYGAIPVFKTFDEIDMEN
jgi:AAA15 family ATPase/GTPase